MILKGASKAIPVLSTFAFAIMGFRSPDFDLVTVWNGSLIGESHKKQNTVYHLEATHAKRSGDVFGECVGHQNGHKLINHENHLINGEMK